MLDTAIGSFPALGSLYEQRKSRGIEKHRLDGAKEKVQLLLKQVLGVDVVGNLVETVGQCNKKVRRILQRYHMNESDHRDVKIIL